MHAPRLQRGGSTSRCYCSKQKAVNSSRSRLSCHASVIWRQLEGTKAWVAHPRAARVNGVIHFLGGAFAGAAPQLLYNGFIETLADAGYTAIATPYAVTFRHDQCAKAVRQSFLDSITELRASGRSYLVPKAAPLLGVGHSNGALLHLLIGSLEPGATQANVIISYNNLQVSDAIPIPGLLENLQPTVQAARSMSSSEDADNDSSSSSSGRRSPGLPLPLLVPTSEQVLAAAAATVPAFLLPAEQQLLAGAAPALDQLASIVNEVGDGLTDFRPSPEESRAIIAAGYSCPSTLLVQFENDNFDETPEMQQILTQRLSSLIAHGNSNGSRETSLAEVSSNPTVTAAAAGSCMSLPATAADLNAWSSIDEDIDINRVLAQLNLLQQQQQQLPGQHQQPGLQALLLPGSHVTPCGGQVRQDGGLLRAAQPDSRELKSLSRQVLTWLEECRKSGRAVAPAAAAPGRQ